MHTIARLAALAASLAAATPALANNDTQYWRTIQLNAKLADQWTLSNETVFRSSDAKGFYEIENATLIGYKPVKGVTVAAGYVGNPLFNHGDYTTWEHRLRSQVTFDNFLALGPVKLTGRARIESRWRDNAPGNGWRLRPYIKASVPVRGKTVLNLTHEDFINLNTTSFQKVDGLERMRNAILLNTPIGKGVAMEFGYLNQHGFVRNGTDTSDNVLMLQVNASF